MIKYFLNNLKYIIYAGCLLQSVSCKKSAAPKAEFIIEGGNCEAPCEVIFRSTSTGATNLKWEFGDTGIKHDQTVVQHLYAVPRTYIVTLTAINENGEDKVSHEVVIRQTLLPEAKFTFSPQQGVAPCEVFFTNTSTNADSWSWTFGDGGFSDQKSPLHRYDNPGTFAVRLIASGSGGSDTLQDNVVITAPAPMLPIANFEVFNNYCVVPCLLSFNNTSQNATGGYEWDFGDNTPPLFEENPVHEYQLPGTYQVSLTVSNSVGQTNSKTIPVTIAPKKAFLKSLKLSMPGNSDCTTAPIGLPDISFVAIRDNESIDIPTDIIGNTIIDLTPPVTWTFTNRELNTAYTYYFEFSQMDSGEPCLMGRSANLNLLNFLSTQPTAPLDISSPTSWKVFVELEWQ